MNPSTSFVRAEIDSQDEINNLLGKNDNNGVPVQELTEEEGVSVPSILKDKVAASHSAAFFLLTQVSISQSFEVKDATIVASLPKGSLLEVYRPPLIHV